MEMEEPPLKRDYCDVNQIINAKRKIRMRKINIKLAEVIDKSGKSKNMVCYACQLQRTQLNNYCKNKVSRTDLAILARLCDYLECEISDILILE